MKRQLTALQTCSEQKTRLEGLTSGNVYDHNSSYPTASETRTTSNLQLEAIAITPSISSHAPFASKVSSGETNGQNAAQKASGS